MAVERAIVQHVHDHDGHVVRTARLECLCHQGVCRRLGRGGGAGHRLDPGVLDHGGEAVGAHDDPVTVHDVKHEVVGIHVWVVAQRTGDDGARGVDAGLVGRYLARIHELLDIGVVVREAHERPLVQQVDARVAHMGDGHLATVDEHA